MSASPAFTRILIIGAGGQIGTELTRALREKYGTGNVIASDVRGLPETDDPGAVNIALDVTDYGALSSAVGGHGIDCIVNMAAILSSDGEKNPQLAWQVNMGGLYNTLEVARLQGVKRVLCPSSIAAFGPSTPRRNTPQETILRPTTMYGLTKVAGELLCDYYFKRYGVDARGLRYPGIISTEVLPSGGTTDYAVEIFYSALEQGRYTCFLGPDTRLPMMYMPDCLHATLLLLAAPVENLRHHGDFNVAAMSFTPAEIAAEIKKHIPGFEIDYAPDHRQQIAESWPESIDDSCARSEWGWRHEYDLPKMVEHALTRLREKVGASQSAG